LSYQDEAMSNCDASHSLHRVRTACQTHGGGWEKCMVIFIDRASPGDANEVLALQKLAYQSEAELNGDWTIPPLTQTLSEIQSEYETKVFLKAVCGDKIIGSVRASQNSGTCQVGRLIVHPDYQGRGIGTLLMKRIEEAFSCAERFELFTSTKSTSNIRLYRRMGYQELYEEDLSPNVRLVFMEKRRCYEETRVWNT